MEIVCRSPQDIADDTVQEAHTWACRMLDTMSSGRLLYLGEERDALKRIRDYAEQRLLQDELITQAQARELVLMQLNFCCR